MWKDSLIKAMWISMKAHRGQKDRAGKLYIFHPAHVAFHCKGKKEKIVGWLHDTVEDSEITIGDIRAEGFSKEITDAVDILTHKPYVEYMVYIEGIYENEIAKVVKLKDLEHNMRRKRIKNPTEEDFKRWEKYERAHEYLSRH